MKLVGVQGKDILNSYSNSFIIKDPVKGSIIEDLFKEIIKETLDSGGIKERIII